MPILSCVVDQVGTQEGRRCRPLTLLDWIAIAREVGDARDGYHDVAIYRGLLPRPK